jgi:hypothetical protein
MIKLTDLAKMLALLGESKAYLEHNHVSCWDDPHLNTTNINLRKKIDEVLKNVVLEGYVHIK